MLIKKKGGEIQKYKEGKIKRSISAAFNSVNPHIKHVGGIVGASIEHDIEAIYGHLDIIPDLINPIAVEMIRSIIVRCLEDKNCSDVASVFASYKKERK